MEINIKKKTVELKFTFNSFKYMQDFDMGALEDIDRKPFKMIGMVESLLMGAVNSNPKFKVSLEEVSLFLEDYIAENSLNELLEELMKQLQDSNFFRSLQKK